MTGRFRLGVRIALHLAAVAVSCAAAMGQAASRFDLMGPSINVHVQRGDQSLPIAMVPNLQAGDKLTIHAELPRTQSVHMILIVAFLRGSTNPPPDNWFTQLKTWDKKFAEGVTVAVPQEAQQALIFLAPETGGDFSTLKSAVTGRPGTFVRASQDLNEASFEQARIERYLQALQRVPDGSSEQLLDHSKKLASTLNLKPNDDCFKKPADQQMACLRQTGGQLLLDDGHGQTLAAALTSGDTANLIGAVAGTPMATANGAGMYSAYVGTVIDLVRLMSGIHTAHFQYIPAIAFPDDESLNLRLNTAPSFHNPKSVIVVALPAIQSSVAPPLRLQDALHVSCLLQPRMVLPLEGAPLVFATSFAHDLHLHLNNGATLNGKTDLPVVADAFEGGLVLTETRGRKPLPVAAPEARDADASRDKPASDPTPDQSTTTPLIADKDGPLQITGTLQGMWGFDSFSGVTVPLQRLPGGGWTAAEQSDLFTGRENQLRLHADGTACASTIALDQGGHDSPLKWKQAADRKNVLQVGVPLEKAAPGSVHLLVKQFGTPDIEKVAVTAYSDKTRLEAIRIHAGDTAAMLAGTGLGGIVSVKIAGSDYKPSPDGPSADGKSLQLIRAQEKQLGDTRTKPTAFNSGDSGTAEAKLADGRTLPVSYSVDTARPAVDLLRKTLKADSGSGIPLTLNSENAIPLNAKLTLALRSRFPDRFPRSEKIEVALADGSLKATLSLADGSVVLQDSHTALAFLTPAKTFGASAFGPIQARAVANDGTAGDWIPLGTLVRTPVITGVTCTRSTPKEDPNDPGCQITGKDLYLLGSVATDNSFQNETEVPLGFAGDSISVPRPADNHTLYLKLRDDPDVVSTVTAIVPPSPRRSATPASATTAPATTPPANGPQPDAAIPQAAAAPALTGTAQPQ